MNNLLAVMEAVSYSVRAGSNQQLADAQTTTLDVNIEQYEYNKWNQKINGFSDVTGDAQEVILDAAALAADPTNPKLKAALTEAQTKLQNDQTNMQTNTQQCDSATQAMQNQTGQDSSTMQQKVQLEAAVNQTLQTLASALGQHY